jgi:hypothetical protein
MAPGQGPLRLPLVLPCYALLAKENGKLPLPGFPFSLGSQAVTVADGQCHCFIHLSAGHPLRRKTAPQTPPQQVSKHQSSALPASGYGALHSLIRQEPQKAANSLSTVLLSLCRA